MARRGENIRKRSDGRWEGRYIKGRSADGKPAGAMYMGQPMPRCGKSLPAKRQSTAFIT